MTLLFLTARQWLAYPGHGLECLAIVRGLYMAKCTFGTAPSPMDSQVHLDVLGMHAELEEVFG